MKNNFITSLLIVAVFTLTLGLTGCDKPSNTAPNKVTMYEKILTDNKIRVGYISYPPNFIKNPDGTYAGIFYETMEEIGNKLGLEIEYTEEVTWGGMIEAVKTGRVDMVVTGIWPTTERGKHVDFANPLFFSAVKAYVHTDNNKFDSNLEAINSADVKIATIDGEMTSIIANADFPNAKQSAVSQLSGVVQALLDIKVKKADVAFVEPAVALEFDSKNPNSIKEVADVKPLRIFPNAMMLPKDEVAFKSTLNTAINELIYNGFVDKVINKYEKYPNSFYRIQPAYSQD